jgi:hypothetical protein
VLVPNRYCSSCVTYDKGLCVVAPDLPVRVPGTAPGCVLWASSDLPSPVVTTWDVPGGRVELVVSDRDGWDALLTLSRNGTLQSASVTGAPTEDAAKAAVLASAELAGWIRTSSR